MLRRRFLLLSQEHIPPHRRTSRKEYESLGSFKAMTQDPNLGSVDGAVKVILVVLALSCAYIGFRSQSGTDPFTKAVYTEYTKEG